MLVFQVIFLEELIGQTSPPLGEVNIGCAAEISKTALDISNWQLVVASATLTKA